MAGSIEDYAGALTAAIEAALPGWVTGCVERVMRAWAGEVPPEVGRAAEEAGQTARTETGAAIRTLLAADIDEHAARGKEKERVVEQRDRLRARARGLVKELLEVLDRAAGELGKTLAVLLQVNAGLDPAKSGVEPGAAAALLRAALERRNIRVEGLMTVAPLSEDAGEARRTFSLLREIRDRMAAETGAPLPELSMGMSGDLEAAIAEGSTLVRVGSALFGERS